MFFVLIGLLFGFLSGREHHAFAVFFLTDSFGMLYLFSIWLLYTLFCIHFLLNLWKQPEYGFVYHTRLWSKSLRVRRFGIVALGFLQPLIYYGIYLFSIALQDKLLSRISPILFFYITLISGIIVAGEWRIRNPRLFVNKKQGLVSWQFPRPASWTFWSLEWLFREKGVTLLVCKGGAMMVFVCTLIYYGTDNYDLRLPAIGLSLAYLLNVGLSYELYQWEGVVWLWNRSLPVSINRKYLRALGLHMLIILPETLISFRYNILSIVDLLQLYTLGFSVLVVFYAYLYKKNGLLEDTMQAVLLSFIALTLLILYKVPIMLIALSLLMLSFFFYKKWYQQPGSLAQ